MQCFHTAIQNERYLNLPQVRRWISPSQVITFSERTDYAHRHLK